MSVGTNWGRIALTFDKEEGRDQPGSDCNDSLDDEYPSPSCRIHTIADADQGQGIRELTTLATFDVGATI